MSFSHLAEGFRRPFFVALSAFSLAGCASGPLQSPSEMAHHRIAVIALAAEQLRHEHVGITRLDSFDTHQDIRSWQLDDLLARRMANAIHATLGSQVVVPDVDRSALDHVYDVNGALKLLTSLRPPNWDAIAPELQRIAALNQADWVVVLLGPDALGTETSVRAGDHSAAFADINLYLIDGKSAKELAHDWVAKADKRWDGSVAPSNFPRMEIPKALASKPVAQMAPYEQEQLRSAFVQMLNGAVMGSSVARLFDVPVRYVPDDAFAATSHSPASAPLVH